MYDPSLIFLVKYFVSILHVRTVLILVDCELWLYRCPSDLEVVLLV